MLKDTIAVFNTPAITLSVILQLNPVTINLPLKPSEDQGRGWVNWPTFSRHSLTSSYFYTNSFKNAELGGIKQLTQN